MEYPTVISKPLLKIDLTSKIKMFCNEMLM